MKTETLFILALAALLSACNNPSSHPKTDISDCHPDLTELRMPTLKMAAETEHLTDRDYIDMGERHMFAVNCVSENSMYISCYCPDFTCCLTPHCSCTRSGSTITFKCWETGLMPCNCLCPRKIETLLTGIPYGEYTLQMKFKDEVTMSATLNFTATTDTLLIEHEEGNIASDNRVFAVYMSIETTVSQILTEACKADKQIEGDHICSSGEHKNEVVTFTPTEDGWHITAPGSNSKIGLDIYATFTGEDNITYNKLVGRKYFTLNGNCLLKEYNGQSFTASLSNVNISWNHYQTTYTSTNNIYNSYKVVYRDSGEITTNMTVNGETATYHYFLHDLSITCRETNKRIISFTD